MERTLTYERKELGEGIVEVKLKECSHCDTMNFPFVVLVKFILSQVREAQWLVRPG